ncbi:putative metalloprotease CJM1_0395 family protein [Emcibacter sp.]|uniref:putative metalloprotease CJM1_0395 family protein n=1 Tax=Emcibacter sp. TaxID=1979954 RepID=UPI003A92848D
MISAVSPSTTGVYPAPQGSTTVRPSEPSGSSGAHVHGDHDAGPAKKASSSAVSSSSEGQLTEEEQAKVKELQSVDREIRAHEQAHKAAGGQHAGAASYSYVTGPDGKRYAVSGEVPINIAPVEGDPAATAAKMEQVISAALAPADPSAQDRKVAAQARAAKSKALAEANALRAEENSAKSNSAENSNAPAGQKPISGVSAYQAADGLSVTTASSGLSFAV